MKNCVRFFSSAAFLVSLFGWSFTFLQAQPIKISQNLNPAFNFSAPPKNEPFRIGETLVYEAKFSRLLLRGIDVADLTFTIIAPEKSSPDKIQLKGEVVSKGSLLKLFSFSFLQKFDSTVQTDNFRILQTLRHDEQDKRVRTSEATFDYPASKLIYRELDPNNLMSPPRMIISPLEAPAQDLISAFYYLRRQPLKTDKTLKIQLSDSGIIYEVPIKVVARQQLKSVVGKVWTLRLEPEIFGDKRPLAGEGKMIIWLTDDVRRLPVRAQIQTNIGKIEIKLRRAENLQAVK